MKDAPLNPYPKTGEPKKVTSLIALKIIASLIGQKKSALTK